ncbi:hypothetical protein J2X36_002717 [Methylobacterium sp. BE186]|nr:hypothetical protein [Methylobacterium sp. BE186]
MLLKRFDNRLTQVFDHGVRAAGIHNEFDSLLRARGVKAAITDAARYGSSGNLRLLVRLPVPGQQVVAGPNGMGQQTRERAGKPGKCVDGVELGSLISV